MTAKGLGRFAAAALLALGLVSCAGQPTPSVSFAPRLAASEPSTGAIGLVDASKGVQECVPFARTTSGIAIYGDAYTWWDQAAGRFIREAGPEQGAVLVLAGYAGPKRAHLAVVRQVLSSRLIRVDHANWLNDGAVYLDNPVRDVSPANDWSVVQVFNIRTQNWGTNIYDVQGFIADRPALPGPDLRLAKLPVPTPRPAATPAVPAVLPLAEPAPAQSDPLGQLIASTN